MTEKVLGYFLIVLGILTIIFSVYNIYQIFASNKQPVNIFNFEGITIDLNNLVAKQTGATSIPRNETELISADIFNKPLNLIAHLFLMGFISNSGLKIAIIGTNLVRPINVKLQAKEVGQKKESLDQK